MKLMQMQRKWKNIDKDEVHNDIVKTRGCFQTTCTEWDSSTMEEKVELLKDLVNNKGYDSLQLAMQMMKIYNEQYGKEINETDLLMGMSRILDFLLREFKNN
jgi:acyl carrier protein